MKSKTEIVLETLRFYNRNNRGYNYQNDHCTYYDEATGNKCAVGRCILDSEIERVSELERVRFEKKLDGPSVILVADHFKGLDGLLKPEYRGHCIEFWQNLQSIHDDCSIWDENGFYATDYNFEQIYMVFEKEVVDAVMKEFSEK